MAVSRENLKELQSLVVKSTFDRARGKEQVRLGHAPADEALCGGLDRDGLHEIFAAGVGEEATAAGFALALAGRVATKGKWLLWVRQDLSALEAGEPYACGLKDFGIDPTRVLIVHAKDATATLRAGAEGLTCPGLSAVIIEAWGEPKVFDLVASRKLALAVQQHGIAALVLRFGAEPEASAAETRWLVKAAPSSSETDDWETPLLEVALVRNRHGRTGQWLMEWDRHNGLFRAPHPGAGAAVPSHGPAETSVEGIRQAG